MLLCCACSATLDGPSLPSHTEKAEAPPTSLNCGQHVVCGACARRTPSLARSCILCSPVLPPPPASKLKEIGAPPPLDPFYAVLPPDDGEFVLGGNSDDEDGEEAPPMVVFDEAPPSYVDEEGFGTKLEEKGGREQSTLHYLKPEETLAGLALRYGVPGHLLCTINKLPISTLSTTPHLVHTLPFLLLPPGSRPSTSSEPLLPAPLERKRLLVRRFQTQAKVAEVALAQAYIDQVYKAREEEARFVAANRRARGEEAEMEGDLEVREGGELEEALEAWRRDERWEREQQTLGKGKEAMGSRIKTTGQVEQKVRKGWGWR